MAIQRLNPSGVCQPVGPYSQAVLVVGPGRWLHIAGQIGVDEGGQLASGFQLQADQAWKNVATILGSAGMNVSHLVSVVTYLVREEDLPDLGAVRLAYLGDARPASTLILVKSLARKEWLIEVEATAFCQD